MAGNTIKVKMKSSASAYFKTTTKNPRNHPEKMKLDMYDPTQGVRKHVTFNEQKVK